MAPIGEAPDGVRSLVRAQDPFRVVEKGYGGWFKAWMGTGRTVEMKQTPEEEPKQTLRDTGQGDLRQRARVHWGGIWQWKRPQ